MRRATGPASPGDSVIPRIHEFTIEGEGINYIPDSSCVLLESFFMNSLVDPNSVDDFNFQKEKNDRARARLTSGWVRKEPVGLVMCPVTLLPDMGSPVQPSRDLTLQKVLCFQSES